MHLPCWECSAPALYSTRAQINYNQLTGARPVGVMTKQPRSDHPVKERSKHRSDVITTQQSVTLSEACRLVSVYSRKRAKRVSSPAVWDEDQGRHESNLETQCRRTLRGMGRGMLRELVEGLGRPPRVAEDLSVTDRINHDLVKSEGTDYASRVATGEPLAGMISGRLPLVWAHAQLVYDSPEKKRVLKGQMVGRLMHRPVADAAAAVQSELLMVTPYLIPGSEGMQLFSDLRKRNVRVRILTNSLESSTVLVAQSGYMHYRLPLLKEGVEIYEVRSLLGNARGSGQTTKMTRYGNYSLHAKLFVFDRKRLFIGSMNFDQRSMHLNTEIGLIIDSPELAQQTVARFESMVSPPNSYELTLLPRDGGRSPRLVWRTQEDGKAFEYDREPARSNWQKLKVELLTLLPLDDEL